MGKVHVHVHKRTADHRLDFKPDTDADRRARIQEVMRACGVTHMVALRWLEAEEWITDTTIRELKHAMKLGFTVDAADPVAKMDDEVRAAYAKLCEAFTAGSPGIRQLRSDFIAKVYAYGKKAGRDHPLARVMDGAAPRTDDAKTGDRGYPDIATLAGNVMRWAQRVANLANGDGDAEDVHDIKDAAQQTADIAAHLTSKARTIKPLITEK